MRNWGIKVESFVHSHMVTQWWIWDQIQNCLAPSLSFTGCSLFLFCLLVCQSLTVFPCSLPMCLLLLPGHVGRTDHVHIAKYRVEFYFFSSSVPDLVNGWSSCSFRCCLWSLQFREGNKLNWMYLSFVNLIYQNIIMYILLIKCQDVAKLNHRNESHVLN